MRRRRRRVRLREDTAVVWLDSDEGSFCSRPRSPAPLHTQRNVTQRERTSLGAAAGYQQQKGLMEQRTSGRVSTQTENTIVSTTAVRRGSESRRVTAAQHCRIPGEQHKEPSSVEHQHRSQQNRHMETRRLLNGALQKGSTHRIVPSSVLLVFLFAGSTNVGQSVKVHLERINSWTLAGEPGLELHF